MLESKTYAGDVSGESPGASDARIDAYLDHLRVVRRLQPLSIESYSRDLLQLARFAAGRGTTPDALSLQDLEAFVRGLMAHGYSPRSVARMVAGVRGFYKHLLVSRLIATNPAEDLRPPRAWRELPRYLSLDEVDALLAAPDLSTPRGLRDRALLDVLYATGLRVTELVTLRPSDLNLDVGFLTCIGKGDKQRIVPVGEQAIASLRTYMAGGRTALLKGQTSPWLFPGGRVHLAVDARRVLEADEDLRAQGRGHERCLSARAAALVRNALAGPRSRPAGHPDDARPCGAVDDPDLHARARGAAEAALRRAPSREPEDRREQERRKNRRQEGRQESQELEKEALSAGRRCDG